jgi:hypothetical protein
MITLLLVVVTLIGYLAGRMRAAPMAFDLLAGAGVLALCLLSAFDPLALAGAACGLTAGLYAGSIGAVKRARGIAPHQRLAAAGRRLLSR